MSLVRKLGIIDAGTWSNDCKSVQVVIKAPRKERNIVV